MKKQVVVQGVSGEGLDSLLGKGIFVMCGNYFYTGILAGVNDVCIRIDDPSIVYATGDWSDKTYSDAQKMRVDRQYIMISHIESFGSAKGS